MSRLPSAHRAARGVGTGASKLTDEKSKCSPEARRWSRGRRVVLRLLPVPGPTVGRSFFKPQCSGPATDGEKPGVTVVPAQPLHHWQLCRMLTFQQRGPLVREGACPPAATASLDRLPKWIS